MAKKNNGDYLIYHVDWDKDEMTLLETGGTYEDLKLGTMPVTPFAHALRKLAIRSGLESKKCRFILNAEMDWEESTVLFTLHPTDDFRSVVDVNRSLIARLLGTFLSPRELEVAVELFEGRTIRYIAVHLHIAEGTVKRVMHNVYRKLNVASQVELIREIYARLAQNAGQEAAAGSPKL